MTVTDDSPPTDRDLLAVPEAPEHPTLSGRAPRPARRAGAAPGRAGLSSGARRTPTGLPSAVMSAMALEYGATGVGQPNASLPTRIRRHKADGALVLLTVLVALLVWLALAG